MRRRDVVGAVMCGYGFIFVGLGTWGAVHPVSLGATVAAFGPYNSHLIHDFAACAATFGGGLLVGWRLPSWRVPTLVLSALWNALHGFAHIADIGMTDIRYLGLVEAVLLCSTSSVLGFLAVWELHRAASADEGRGRAVIARGQTLSDTEGL